MTSAETLRIPVQSDPPTLHRSVLGLSGAASLAFAAMFAQSHLSAFLGVIPGMMVGVFGGAALAARGRRRGGTVSLLATPGRLDVSDPQRRVEVLDLTSPYGALLLTGSGRRVLVLSQRHEPVVLLEEGATPAELAAPWKSRALAVDLGAVALSSATTHAFALLPGESLDALLAHLVATLEPDAPWMVQSTPGGLLTLGPGELVYADRPPLKGDVQTLAYGVKVQGGQVAGLGLASAEGEGGMLLLATEEATIERIAVPTDNPVDAFIATAAYEVLRAVYGQRRAAT